MKPVEIKETPATEIKKDPMAAIALENFEIEDIRDIDLFAPLTIQTCSCSSCSSTSSS